MSSPLIGIAITLVGVLALAVAILGSRLRHGKRAEPETPVVPKEAPSVQVPPPVPANPIPPPPPSKTSGLHFGPAMVGAQTPPASRRAGGSYVRRAPPKRSTATKRKQEDAAS